MTSSASASDCGQRADALGGALLGRHLEDVVRGLGRELVALLDALEPGGEHHREREVRVARRVGRAELDAGASSPCPSSASGTRTSADSLLRAQQMYVGAS